MATRKDDFDTIASIIKREIQKRKKQKKPKDELINCIPISNASAEDETELLLFKKKKKKKKRDKKMLQNDENMNNYIGTLEVDEFYTETCDENKKHLYLDETMDSNLSKDEFTRNINISKISERDSLFKKKKKKKKRDKKMLQNDENMNNHIGTLEVDEFYTEICDENNKHLYLDETMDSNFNKDEFTRNISITNDSEGDLLFKKKKKKKKRDKKMVQINKYLKNDKATLKVEQFYNDTCNDKIKYLNKINKSGSNLNKDNSTTSTQIANASEDDEELTLLKSPLKKSKLKKIKSKKAKKEDTESSKCESIQKKFKNMEDMKKCISEEQSNEFHNGKICILQISSKINILETAITAY
ncbi:unnamed protein product [Macrosiphum euphorbiae]|uniref:Uncharacterized protein n=1 Tax=Macrosiphum euphorbiae TaxID=13131 RepID=A0AAV0XBC2_9HEMI|nr:unnamed protein product [Macrosiphum euphorbiae]